MDEDAKKTALRMIPYGLYVLTAEGKDGAVAAATINWVTQASFGPPLVVTGVKADSGAHAIITETVARGDHSIFVGEVTDASVRKAPDGRHDDATLWPRDLGDTVFCGG